MLQTSFLPALTGPLCDALTNRSDGEQSLETLERNNLFVEPLDGAGVWYRYHALFAAAMQQEARRRLGAAQLGELARRAGRWYEQHDMPVEAVEAAFRAQDFDHAAELIERLFARRQHRDGSQELTLTPGYHTLRAWLERLPAAQLDKRPVLYLAHASAVLYSFFLELSSNKPLDRRRIEDSLQKAERGLSQQNHTALLGEVFAFRAMLARELADFTGAASWAIKALDNLPREDYMSRSLSLNSLGAAEMVGGSLERSVALFSEAKMLCELAGNRTYARANMGILSWAVVEQGKLHQAAENYRQMSAEAYAEGDIDDIIHSQFALAEIDYEWNNLAAAQEHATTAITASAPLMREFDSFGGATLVQARIALARGQAEKAEEYFALLLDHEDDNSVQAREIRRSTRADQARYWITRGALTAAQHWSAGLDPNDSVIPPSQHEQEKRIVARLLIAQEKPDEALDLLQACLEYARERGRKRDEQEILVIMALAYAALKQAEPARQNLQTALEMAYSEGFMRVFLDEGPALIALLQSVLPGLREKSLIGYSRALLNAFTSEQTARGQALDAQLDTLTEPLSKQEKRVLQLLAAGRTNPEIAEELVVSVNTIKAQVKSIYRKLNVSTRQEASLAAQSMTLS